MTRRKLLTAPERRLAERVGRLAHTNPFLPARVELERETLGRAYQDTGSVLARRPGREADNPNMRALFQRVERLMARLRRRLADGVRVSPEDRPRYEDLLVFLLYLRHEASFYPGPEQPRRGAALRRAFQEFREELEHLGRAPGLEVRELEDPAHLFACFHQLGRAYHHIHRHILGRSLPTARMRAAAWQSIFTHDMRRYRRALAPRMADVPTLIVGPSGTGKELVAQAIGRSRYLPFDPEAGRFRDQGAAFHALNVSALTPTLVESELFGHRRGAFTGAVADRAGWLETCGPGGTVFLDEVGDIDPAVQVKLLRVLQERSFQRLGEVEARPFSGKIVAATHRDLAAEVAAGSFREDFYYRLCADVVEVPTLDERLRDCPEELDDLVGFLAARVAGAEEAEALAEEVRRWIREGLPPGYPWPGNVRELEQCVRNVMVRAAYRPLAPRSGEPGLAAQVAAGALDAEELLDRYCALVHDQAGSFAAAARRLGLDRRTVKARASRGRAARVST